MSDEKNRLKGISPTKWVKLKKPDKMIYLS
jgi:hypothetical protein